MCACGGWDRFFPVKSRDDDEEEEEDGLAASLADDEEDDVEVEKDDGELSTL